MTVNIGQQLPYRRGGGQSGEGGVPGLTSAGWLNLAGASIAPAWAGRAPGHVTTAVSWDFPGASVLPLPGAWVPSLVES